MYKIILHIIHILHNATYVAFPQDVSKFILCFNYCDDTTTASDTNNPTLDMKIKRGVTNGNIHNRPTGLQ